MASKEVMNEEVRAANNETIQAVIEVLRNRFDTFVGFTLVVIDVDRTDDTLRSLSVCICTEPKIEEPVMEAMAGALHTSAGHLDDALRERKAAEQPTHAAPRGLH